MSVLRDEIIAARSRLKSKHDAAVDMYVALVVVNKLIAEAASTGFNCHDGDWADRLFESQQVTSAALKRARGEPDEKT